MRPLEPHIKEVHFSHEILDVSHGFLESTFHLSLLIAPFGTEYHATAAMLTCHRVERNGRIFTLRYPLTGGHPTPRQADWVTIRPGEPSFAYLSNFRLDGRLAKNAIEKVPGQMRWRVVCAAGLPFSRPAPCSNTCPVL